MSVLIGILATLVVAAAAFWFLYNSRRKGWQETLSERAREAEELRVRNGVLEAQVNSCTARLAEMQTQLDVASREREQAGQVCVSAPAFSPSSSSVIMPGNRAFAAKRQVVCLNAHGVAN